MARITAPASKPKYTRPLVSTKHETRLKATNNINANKLNTISPFTPRKKPPSSRLLSLD